MGRDVRMASTCMNRRKVARLLVAPMSLLAFGSVANASSPETNEAAPTVKICVRPDGSVPAVVDLLLLFDNSKSLNSKVKPPTDKDGKRFDAVESMLTAIGSAVNGSEAEVNFGLIKFGSEAKVLIPFGEKRVTTESASSLAEDIRERLPLDPDKQDRDTNYLNALEAAEQLFEMQSSTHCRVMVWFTDGEFSIEDRSKRDEKLDELKESTCESGRPPSPNGWPSRFRALGVNVFSVILGVAKERKYEETQAYVASLALMQTLTGDQTPDFGPIDEEIWNALENFKCDEDLSYVGDVVTAGDAGSLGGLFQEIGVRVGGGVVLVCPAKSDFESTGKLPDGRFLTKITVFSRTGQTLPSIGSFRVLGPGEDVPSTIDGARKPGDAVEDFLKYSSDTTGSEALTFTPDGPKSLGEGWRLWVGDKTEGLCMAAFPIRPLRVRLAGKAGQKLSVTELDTSLLTDLEKDRIEYRIGNSPISVNDVAKRFEEGSEFSKNLTAFLKVDSERTVYPEQLRITVIPTNLVPDVSCAKFDFTSPRLFGDMPKKENARQYRSTACDVLTEGTSQSVLVDATKFFDLVKSTDGCGDIEVKLLIDGKPAKGPRHEIPKDQTANVSLLIAIKGRKLACKVAVDDGVVFSFKSKNGVGEQEPISAPVSFESLLKPLPNPSWVILVTLCLVFVAALLSLLLLQTINRVMARMPKSEMLYYYEKKALVAFDANQNANVSINNQSLTAFQFQAKDLRPVSTRTSESKFAVGDTKLRRVLPGFFRPFNETRVEVDTDEVAVYWQQSSNGGLAVPFQSAVILRSEPIVGRDVSGFEFVITVLVPRNGRNSGIEGVRNLVQGQRFQELLRSLRDRLTEARPKPSEVAVSGSAQPSPPKPPSGQPSPPKPPSGQPSPPKPPSGQPSPPKPPPPTATGR